MAVQSSFYVPDGSTRTFPSTKHIATKQHVGVYLQRALDSVWETALSTSYELVNNSIVFDSAVDNVLYIQIEIRVVDTTAELIDSPSNIALVAASIADVSTVADSILDVNTVADNIGSVQNTSAISANITTVAGVSGNVTTVANSIANVNTTAINIANVNAVGLDLLEPTSEINTVAVNIADVNTVGLAIASVNTVAGISGNVTTVAGVSGNVTTVSNSIASVNTTATNIADINSVATTIVPNIAEILLADDNATTATAQAGIATTQATNASSSATQAQLSEWEAEAERLTADSYATEAEDTFVNLVTSDGDGTFTYTPTTDYSALHWAAKSMSGDISPIIHAATAKTTPVDADEFAITDSAATFGLKKLTWANIKTTLGALFAPLASPSFTGSPTAPTAAAGTNTTQLATTAGVRAEIPNMLNASGSAPIYACRAWVNFNGTGTVAIRASGNVSSITDNGVGDYTVNFTTAMPDNNYSFNGTSGGSATTYGIVVTEANSRTTTSIRYNTAINTGTAFVDDVYNSISITR